MFTASPVWREELEEALPHLREQAGPVRLSGHASSSHRLDVAKGRSETQSPQQGHAPGGGSHSEEAGARLCDALPSALTVWLRDSDRGEVTATTC